jgi:hypothetical protein
MMDASAGPTPTETALVILVIIVLIFVRRAVLIVRGTVVSPARLFAFAGFYTVLFALIVAFGTVEPPWILYVGLPALLVVSAVISTRHVRGHVVLEQRPPDTRWYYKLHPWILVTYIVLFVARIAISIAVLGPSAAFAFGAPVGALSPLSTALLDIVDVLFAASTGLLLGRSVGVYLAYKEEVASTPSPPPAAPPAAPLPSIRP